MFGEREVDVHVAERAKAVLEKWAKASRLTSLILGIRWAHRERPIN